MSEGRDETGGAEGNRAQEPAQKALLLLRFWEEVTMRDSGEKEARLLGNFALWSSFDWQGVTAIS